MSPKLDVLVVMARFPHPGRVKTRLARRIGTAEAAALYRAFLEDLARRLGHDPRWRLWWAFEPADAPFAADVAAGLPAFAQPDGDLGARMAGSMTEAFRRGAGRVALIGSDLPHLESSRIAEAFARLDEGADLVLGPAEDGGYYLIAAAGVPPVFGGIPWGGADVYLRTLQAARDAGLAAVSITPTWDVDREEDLRRLWRDPVLRELPATAKRLSALFGDPGAAGGA